MRRLLEAVRAARRKLLICGTPAGQTSDRLRKTRTTMPQRLPMSSPSTEGRGLRMRTRTRPTIRARITIRLNAAQEAGDNRCKLPRCGVGRLSIEVGCVRFDNYPAPVALCH